MKGVLTLTFAGSKIPAKVWNMTQNSSDIAICRVNSRRADGRRWIAVFAGMTVNVSEIDYVIRVISP
jgi:hypothetical protein